VRGILAENPLKHKIEEIGEWVNFRLPLFYKRGCQEETLRPQLALRNSLRHPARVLERGSGGFSFLEIHVAGVTTLSISDAGKQRGCGVPTMVLSETRGL
jgi:hypothetical protein